MTAMTEKTLYVLRVPEHRCPQCDHPLDCAMLSDPTTAPPRLPAPGDLSICASCHGVNVFTDDGLRPATPDEAQAVPAHVQAFLRTQTH